MAGDTRDAGSKTPLLLLKTKSAPTDAYEELFSTLEDGRYEPTFVPVLEHRFKQDAIDEVRQHIVNGDFASSRPDLLPKYGALIFTSQRAVEAFARIIEELRRETPNLVESYLPERTPLYVVGPATARGLKSLNMKCPVLGEDTGIGHVLAPFILEDYNKLYPAAQKPHILFLVGEKRRDIVPKTLQSQELPDEQRCVVHELEIYETGEMGSFKSDFSSTWQNYSRSGQSGQWVVVFSPTGCQAMLESLGLLDSETGRVPSDSPSSSRDIKIATIGPTTRDYLIGEFGFTPDVCAEKPTPEGVAEGIALYQRSL